MTLRFSSRVKRQLLMGFSPHFKGLIRRGKPHRPERSALNSGADRSRMSREVLIHLSIEMRLTGVVSEVAADEVASELVRGVHDDEAAGRRIYDKITRPSDRTDELSDETDRLDMGVKC